MSGDSLELVSAFGGLSDGVSVRYTLPERRKRARSRLRLSVLMFRDCAGTDVVESTTCDLSSNGFYCLSHVQFAVGERLVCSLKIPTHDPDGKHFEQNLECTVRVIRVVPRGSGDLFGIACQIDDYHVSQIAL